MRYILLWLCHLLVIDISAFMLKLPTRASFIHYQGVEDYMKEAKEFFGSNGDPDLVMKFALVSQSKYKDNQSEKKDILLELDKKEAYLLSKMAFTSQRYLLEKLFNDVVSHYRNDLNFSVLVNNTLTAEKNLLVNLKSADPKLSPVNKVLLYDNIWDAYWESKKTNTTILFPKDLREKNIIYGSVSEIIHAPDLKAVAVPQNMEPTMKVFFTAVAELFQSSIVAFDHELVALAALDPQDI